MTLNKSIITHPRWGTVIITRNPRARRIIMRARPDAIYMTAPMRATAADIDNALDKCGDRLLKAQQEKKPCPIDKDFSIDTPNFRLNVKEDSKAKITVTRNNSTYTLHCPAGTDYDNEKMQETLRCGINAAIRHRAKELLPQRLKTLAAEHGFTYNRCTVRDVHSRWGSCTSEGNISLNSKLVTLPDRLIDYVLLHELCHTVEMNHSDRFWALMDRHTAPERAKALRARLKKHACM
jgi:predicted metal-dependent hydrolase